MSDTSDPLDPRDAAILAQLAAAAMSNFDDGPVLPTGWSLARSFIADPWDGAGQGLLALGSLPGDPSTPVAVLALGVPWGTALGTALAPQTSLIKLPLANILPRNGVVVTGIATAYMALRGKLWNAVKSAGNRPLHITGLYLGGPAAQIAAVDLRPDNTGPDGTKSPVRVASCVSFSSPGPGDADVAVDVASLVSQAWTLSRRHLGEMIDFFPVSIPAENIDAGLQMVLPAAISDPIDDPWMERSASAYITSLGQVPPPGPPEQPGNLSPIPQGFSANNAAAFAQLLSLPYLMRQHPGLKSPTDFSPYSYHSQIKYADKTLATVMVWDDRAVICFRGSVDWYEWGQYTLDSNLVPPPFPSPSTGLIHSGALTMYQDGGDASVKTQMATLLPKLRQDHPNLFFAAHGLGAAVATIAAMDQLDAGNLIKAPAFYIYGGLMTGNSDFVTEAQAKLDKGYYPIARPGDFMPTATLFQGYSPIAPALSLTGVPKNDEPTNHALTGYMELLSPWSSANYMAPAMVLASRSQGTGSPTQE
ncbi:lipase family protein [Telmatospirillum siberiense]|uniref:Fungal lipase-type domain-containing protein n=1 Tax=Telmatospirillum siberiense TaxID=382514 RepID=A0A2N3PU16_9PROT|nr:hypothetical protein [Telmatospirillum siberiense]PKU23893.1 hypothetical protein CWS72_14550 [Telmatospirillum siberiense]